MAAVGESGSPSGGDDPYSRLGLSEGASFEEVQAARTRCLDAIDDDPQAKAKVEAAYDAVLMARLRDRQQGQVSAAAVSASQKEESGGSASPSVPGVSVLQRLRPKLPSAAPSLSGLAPTWELVEGQGLIVRLVLGALALLFLVITPGAGQLVLALGVIGCFMSQIRRGRRPLPSLGWVLLVVGAGLLLGTVFTAALSPTAFSQLGLANDQIQAIPAALLLWAASLLLA